MKVLYDIKKSSEIKGALITIGIFDGVHKGHRALLRKLIKKARAKRKKSVVITFMPHPYKILHPRKSPPMLMSLDHRIKLLGEMGIGYIAVLNFNRVFSNLSAEDFISGILVKKMKMSELFIGDNFKLGHKRVGSVGLLKKLALKYNFKLTVIKRRKINGELASSTKIRKFVIRGKFEEAVSLLGRRVSVLGTVVSGDRLARTLGFPTSNVDPHHEAIPPSGVYAVIVKYDGVNYKGVLNIGFRPTFKRKKRKETIEVHILDFNKDIYGKDLEIFFIGRIRNEKRFRNKGHLKKQIREDIKQARFMLEYNNNPC